MSGIFLKSKNKILLIGGSETWICNKKSNLFKNITSPTKENLNLLKKIKIKKYLGKKFNTIINCAGYPRIRNCEMNKKKSFKLNVKTTKNLVDEMIVQEKKNMKKIKLIQISSDAVYSSPEEIMKVINVNQKHGFCKLNQKKL